MMYNVRHMYPYEVYETRHESRFHTRVEAENDQLESKIKFYMRKLLHTTRRKRPGVRKDIKKWTKIREDFREKNMEYFV